MMANKRGLLYICQECGYKAEKARACKHYIMQHVAEADIPFRCSLCACRTMDRESMDSHITWFNKHMRLAKSKDCLEPSKVKWVIVESCSPFRFDYKNDVCSATASESETEWAARTRTVLVKKDAAEELTEPDVSIEQPPPQVETVPEHSVADNDGEEPPCKKSRREESPSANSDSSSGSTSSSEGSNALLLKEVKGLREDVNKFNKTMEGMEGQMARIIRRMDAELQYFKEVSTCLSSIKHSLKK